MNFCLQLLKYVRVRIARGFVIGSLGPNESRIAYDLCMGFVALLAAIAFEKFFVPGLLLARSIPLVLLPIGFVLMNAAFGIYSSRRTAPARLKATLLLLSIVIVAVVSIVVSRSSSLVVLWAIIISGPVTLARLLLGLHYSKHENLRVVVADGHGPTLVIGGAGYIGSQTVGLLLKQGQQVRVLDRLMYGIEPLREYLDHPNFKLIEGDSTDITKLTLAMKDASAVVHLAGLVGDPACAIDSELTRHINIVATRMAKDVAQSLGVRRFAFASSCSVYGASDKEVSESDSLNPVSLYAQTKIDSERELLHSVSDDFFITVLRFATVFGHSNRPRFDLVGNLFTAQAMTNGLITVVGPDQWRPFVHVSDLARAIVLVLNSSLQTVQGQIFNVGDKRLNLTILQLAEKIKAVTSKYREVSISVRNDSSDLRNYAVSFEKISSILGFQCQTLIEKGIEEMADNFARGQYQDYRQPRYSNFATTKQLLEDFYDPEAMSKLYGPLTISSSTHA